MTVSSSSAATAGSAASAASAAFPAAPLIHAASVSKSFGRRAARKQVLFDVDIDVRPGECLAVIGGSGSGKSTLTRILFGLETADSGIVEYCGQPVVGLNARHGGKTSLRRESGLVFQDPFSSLDPRWRVGRSIAEPLTLQHRGLTREQIDERVRDALDTVGLGPVFLDRYPVDLSGGQAQRVAIARAIINEPKVILADEPMSAIDVAARVQILEAFAAIRAARPETALVMVSHDLGVVQHIADRILVLHDGHVEECGPTAAVLGDPRSAYTRQLIEAASL